MSRMNISPSTRVGAVAARSIAIACAAFVGLASLTSPGAAAPIAPEFSVFGDLAGATFGGDGIPTDPTAITTFDVGAQTVTLGLAATPRFTSPALGNDGAGTYSAVAGTSISGSGLVGSTWNFSYFIGIDGAGPLTVENGGFELLYDFDTAVNTEEADHGVWNLSNTAAFFGASAPFQGSENLLFGFLSADVAGFIDAPAGSFDPFAAGEYTFALRSASAPLGQQSAIRVNVAAVPLPAALPLLAAALGGIGLMGWRRRNAA